MNIRGKLKVHPAGLALLVLTLVFWIIALGGIAACTNDCYNNKGASVCGRLYQVQWWALWFEFFLVCIMLGMSFTDAFVRGRLIFLCYLSMVTVLLTISARDFITDTFSNFDGTIDVKDTAEAARAAAAVGYVLLCIMNFLIIIFVGIGASSPQAQGYGQFSNQAPPPERGYASSAPYQSSPATF